MQESGVIIFKSQIGNIYEIQHHKELLDSDLATLYGVETRAINQAVSRNIERFPKDFMFKLTLDEGNSLRSQFVISKGGRRYTPYAFTEHGILMLSSVLRSEQAISVNIQIMRTFIALRESLTTFEELKQKLQNMEAKYDGQFKIIFEAVRNMLDYEDENKNRKIGFKID